MRIVQYWFNDRVPLHNWQVMVRQPENTYKLTTVDFSKLDIDKDMTIYDPELAEIIKERTPVDIAGTSYYIEPARGGSCDGCEFNGKKCP